MIQPGDIPYIITIIFFIVYGFKSGLVMQIATFLGLLVAAFVGPYIYEYSVAHNYMDRSYVSFLFIVIGIYLIFYLVGRLIKMVVQSGGAEVNILFALAGAGIGIIKGLIVCVLFTHMIIGTYLYNHSRMSGYFSKVKPDYFGTTYKKIYQELLSVKEET